MMIGFAIVAVILLAATGFHYLKGGILKSFSMILISLIAAFFALGYFELLGGIIINFSKENITFLVPYVPAISFLLIFALAFSIMQAISIQLIFYHVDFGSNAELAGKIILGILHGYILAGVLLIFAAMLPIPAKYPYPRFDENNTNPDKPKKVFLNPDGFITSLFSRVSSGSFSPFKVTGSFASLHPDFINQLHLNRLGISKSVRLVSVSNEITVPSSGGTWEAPKDLKDADGKAVEVKSGYSLVIVRTGVKKLSGFSNDSSFCPSQFRLLCSQKKDSSRSLVVRSKNAYPIGYLLGGSMMQKIKLSEKITLKNEDLTDDLPQGQGKWFDFVFEVPINTVPFALEFRQNDIAAVPPPVSADKGQAKAITISASQCTSDYAEVTPVESSALYGIVLTGQSRLLEDLPLSVQNETDWKQLQTDESLKPANFSEGKIESVRAELKISGEDANSTGRATHNMSALLKPMKGYNILALKCNVPAQGAVTSGQQLPVLVELNGRIHRPVGVIISGLSGPDKIYEIDYSSVISKERGEDGITVNAAGVVTQAFPPIIWINERTEKLTAFYCLYLIKPSEDLYITSVKPADAAKGAGFVNFPAFIVR